jgi:hypothetical protein
MWTGRGGEPPWRGLREHGFSSAVEPVLENSTVRADRTLGWKRPVPLTIASVHLATDLHLRWTQAHASFRWLPGRRHARTHDRWQRARLAAGRQSEPVDPRRSGRCVPVRPVGIVHAALATHSIKATANRLTQLPAVPRGTPCVLRSRTDDAISSLADHLLVRNRVSRCSIRKRPFRDLAGSGSFKARASVRAPNRRAPGGHHRGPPRSNTAHMPHPAPELANSCGTTCGPKHALRTGLRLSATCCGRAGYRTTASGGRSTGTVRTVDRT